ncbi:hypothetical protein ACQP3L_34060, partial [Escherichia coli]
MVEATIVSLHVFGKWQISSGQWKAPQIYKYSMCLPVIRYSVGVGNGTHSKFINSRGDCDH